MQNGPRVDTTNTNLINDVKNDIPDGWSDLILKYTPLVFYWCRRSGFSADDSSDITQNVFASVHQSINGFKKKNPSHSFRSWLWKITRYRICDYIKLNEGRPQARGGSEIQQILKEQAAPSLESDDTDEDSLIKLLHIAMAVASSKVSEKTWQAFEMLIFESMSYQEISEKLEMSETAVRVIKSRMLKRLKEEIIKLQEHQSE
jgi:RNA polymerase sigma-70 factor, ECF subfamily